MGVDSTALLLRWLTEPDSRDFGLDRLVVLTAQTGDEFQDTKRLVETHLLHRLRTLRIRYVQVARSGPVEADGITVLDDTCTPASLHIQGDYRLSQELQTNGTIPQLATGQRRCTHKHKGFPLTRWTDQEFGDEPVRKVIGYNADEAFRARRSEGYSTDRRSIEYPLIEWDWGREKCEAYVREMTGEIWRKSLCVFCPFAGGKPDILSRYRAFPAEAAEALFLEHVSLSLNPRAPLYGRKSLRDVIQADGNIEALQLLEDRLNDIRWAIYRVRRIVWAKGRADRKTEQLRTGSREQMTSLILKQGGQGRIPRITVIDRQPVYPTREELLVAAPAVVENKCRPRFGENWAKLDSDLPLLPEL